MNKRNLGYKFEKEFGNWLKKEFAFIIKLPDTRSLRLKSKIVSAKAGVTSFQELTGTKTPADFWSLRNGTSFLWECKHTINKSLPFDRISQHQYEALRQHYNEGGESYLVIGFNNEEAYAIHINEWDWLKEKFENKGRKSLPKMWIKEKAQFKFERRTPSQLEGEDKARYEVVR